MVCRARESDIRYPIVVIRLSFVVTALALAATAGWRFSDHRRQVRELASEVAPRLAEGRREALLRRLAREPDLATARAQAARALLAEALAPPAGGPLPTREEKLAQLESARAQAAQALADNPASWEASMIVGAATYLARSLARDDRLFSEPAAWEIPLARARELAPGQPEPARFAAMAYLEVWALLPDWKRREVRELVATGLAHRDTFDRLIGPWLDVADDLEAALELVPDQPYAWERLRQLFARRQQWEAYRRATAGWRDVLEAEAQRGLAEAEELLADGEAGLARHRLLEVIRNLPAEARFAPLLERVVRRLPAGPVGAEAAAAFERWLDWCLDLCLLEECPLPPEVTVRLAPVYFDLPPPRAALVALAAGDLVRAESFERRADGLLQEDWAPYLVLKARRLVARGRAEEAEAALASVSLAWNRHPAYWQALLAVARGRQAEPLARTAEERLDALRRSSWPPVAWRRDGDREVLVLVARGPAEGLAIALAEVPPVGAVVEVRWDGAVAGTFVARPGEPALILPLAVEEGLHRLELTTLAGAARLRPGRVALASPEGRPHDR